MAINDLLCGSVFVQWFIQYHYKNHESYNLNVADVRNVDLSSKVGFMKSKNMNVGFSITAAFADLRKTDLVTKRQIALFFLMLPHSLFP